MMSHQKIRKAVFPAAGLGTRFLPATKAQPKEMLPLVDKPIIQYVIEEAVASGLTSIIIVTGKGKNAIEDHFDVSYELERHLAQRGQTDVLKQVRATSRLKDTLVVAVTGRAAMEEMRKAKAAKFNGFLGKPLQIDRFPSQLSRILKGEPVWEP